VEKSNRIENEISELIHTCGDDGEGPISNKKEELNLEKPY
jgi:hypothetical protein